MVSARGLFGTLIAIKLEQENKMKKLMLQLIAYSIIFSILFIIILSLKLFLGDVGCAAVIIALLVGHLWGGWSASPDRCHFKEWLKYGKHWENEH